MEQLVNKLKELVKNNGSLIYAYIRGSHAYGLNVETSDIDTGGIYIANNKDLLSLPGYYKDQVSDEKNDNVVYEVRKFLELLLKSNPNMLEVLFVPERCIIYKHPVMDIILENRDKFLSKNAFNALISYSIEQIRKARGLNKKIVKPIKVRKTPIDFCYTFKGQGSEPVTKFLERNGLKQIYCGLVHIDNMDQAYAVFYDWGQHIHMEWKTAEEFAEFMMTDEGDKFIETVDKFNPNLAYQLRPIVVGGKVTNRTYNVAKWITLYNEEIKPSGYHGIQKEDGSSNAVHLDSVVKGEQPIFHLLYNKNGYASHCREYKEYKEWEANRNQLRYESNLDKNYDAKNIMHSCRLIQMGIELAKTGKFNVDRSEMGDREFLLKIRNHGFEYDEVVKFAEDKKKEFMKIAKNSTLPDEIDREFISNLLIQVREAFETSISNEKNS